MAQFTIISGFTLNYKCVCSRRGAQTGSGMTVLKKNSLRGNKYIQFYCVCIYSHPVAVFSRSKVSMRISHE